MSTQLDPVTGAPLLTPDLGNIDQLPYKVQPVPLQDQTNQPQLGRPYLYPDDVPPVLANINAMNGTQPDQAQTLHTDGEHRLLVASSGGGGGGNAPATYYTVLCGAQIGGSIGGPVTDNGIFSDAGPSAILGMILRLWVTAVDNSGNTATVNLRLDDSTNTQEINLGFWNVGKSTKIYGAGYYSEPFTFSPPIQVSTTYSDGTPPVLFASASHCDWQATLTLFCLP